MTSPSSNRLLSIVSGSFHMPGKIDQIYEKIIVGEIVKENPQLLDIFEDAAEKLVDKYMKEGQGLAVSLSENFPKLSVGLHYHGQAFFYLFFMSVGKVIVAKCYNKLHEINLAEIEMYSGKLKLSCLQSLGLDKNKLDADAYMQLCFKYQALKQNCDRLKKDLQFRQILSKSTYDDSDSDN